MFLPLGDDQDHERTPYVNYGLLALNTLAFAVFCFPVPRPGVSEAFGLVAGDLRPHALFTHMFLHANAFHLLGNMLFLWIFGRMVEERLRHAGYALFYIASGLGSALLHMIAGGDPGVPAIGSSGAISGAIGAAVIFCPRANVKVFIWLWFMAGVQLIPVFAWVGFWVIEQVYFASAGFGGTSYYGHLGGFLAGGALAWAIRYVAGVLRGRRAEPLEAKDAASLMEPRRPFGGLADDDEPVFIDDSVDSYAVVTLEVPPPGPDALSARARAGRGVVARGLPRLEAEKLRGELQAGGLPSALIIDAAPNHPPAPQRVDSVSWDDRTLRLRVGTQIVPLPWSAPWLAVGALLGPDRFIDFIAGRKAAYRVPAAVAVRLTRVDARRRKEEAVTLEELGRDCVRYGLRPAWDWLTFDTPAEYEGYVFRIYHLARATRP